MYRNNTAPGGLWGVDRVTRMGRGQSSRARSGLHGGREGGYDTGGQENSATAQNHANLIDLNGWSVLANTKQSIASGPPESKAPGNIDSAVTYASGPLKADKKTKYLSFPDQMVTFIVGKGIDQKTFKIHKQFACEHSSILKKAFDGGFEEAKTQTYILDDVDPVVFRLLAQYLYSQKVTFSVHNANVDEDLDDTGSQDYSKMCQEQDETLVKLWILADRLLIPKLQNQVIDQIQRVWDVSGRLHEDCYQVVYDNTLHDSPLRRLIAVQCCWGTIPHSELLRISESLGRELLLDMAIEFLKACPERARAKRQDSFDFRENFYIETN